MFMSFFCYFFFPFFNLKLLEYSLCTFEWFSQIIAVLTNTNLL